MTVADLRAWLMQRAAPLTVHYGRPLRFAGRDLPRPQRVGVPTRHGEVRCAVHRPPGVALPPVHVHLHGGAFIMRHPAMDDFFARFLVERADVAVVAVDYDTAPQVRYPVAQEQAHDVAAHLADHGHELGLDGARLGIGGFSAGGNLAASACLQARDRGTFTARLQLLGVPSLDLAESYADKCPVGTPMLGPDVHDLVRSTYFRDTGRRAEPYASPLRAPSLAGLPPTLLLTAELDLLRREGDAYARRLREDGVDVRHVVVPGRDHYFLDAATNARPLLDLMAGEVRRRLVATAPDQPDVTNG